MSPALKYVIGCFPEEVFFSLSCSWDFHSLQHSFSEGDCSENCRGSKDPEKKV